MKQYKTFEFKDSLKEILCDTSPALITNRNQPAAYVIPLAFLEQTENQALRELLSSLHSGGKRVRPGTHHRG
jgi:PHD/YefM family antitoxin component YafN of YafNO toxin-antitoxin module